MTDPTHSSTPDAPYVATVTIFGAGIAGLTAAHELGSRGFKVQVIERLRALDQNGELGMQIGGMARTQYARAHSPKSLFRFDGSDAEHGPDDRSPPSEPAPRGVVPGEHGFRFFPSYYHHIFDTLKKIPSGRVRDSGPATTVYDNVLPTTMQGISAVGINPFVMPREPLESGTEGIVNMQNLARLGYTPQDLQTFMGQIVRYMATCNDRRAADFEDISFWQFLRGYDKRTGTYAYTYSPAFTRDLKFMPKVLAAFDAQWGDARTNGDTYVQLFLNYVVRLNKVDGTLNGPTSEAWFDPWRKHLSERYGVEFHEGNLERFYLDDDGELRWEVEWANSEPTPPPSISGHHYVICALDVVEAERVTRDLPQVGVPGQLAGYATEVHTESFDHGQVRKRDPLTETGLYPWDRLQTLSGIQFYYAAKFELVHGHMYFVDAPWALSSINEQQFWVEPPTLHTHGYNALLSIDVGDWDNPGRDDGPNAWKSSRLRIARETWRQIRHSLEPQRQEWTDYGPGLPMPVWFHIDDNIVFEQRVDEATGKPDWFPAKNLSPFLIPIVGDWKNRPDGDPWDPSLTDENPDIRHELAPGVTVASHGGYWVHWDRLLFCGTWKKTFTRMTTMEAANESARHCVNGLIDHFIERYPQPTIEHHEVETPLEPGTGAPRSIAPWTQIGDYAKIWNIENEELPQFVPLKQIDDWFFRHGLPSPFSPTPLEAAELATRLPAVLWEVAHGVRSTSGPNESAPESEYEPAANGDATAQGEGDSASEGQTSLPRPPGWPDHWTWPPKPDWSSNPLPLWSDPRRAKQQPGAWMAPWPNASDAHNQHSPSSLAFLGPLGEWIEQMAANVRNASASSYNPADPHRRGERRAGIDRGHALAGEIDYTGSNSKSASTQPPSVSPTMPLGWPMLPGVGLPGMGLPGMPGSVPFPGSTTSSADELRKSIERLLALGGLGSAQADPLTAQLDHLRQVRRALEELLRGKT